MRCRCCAVSFAGQPGTGFGVQAGRPLCGHGLAPPDDGPMRTADRAGHVGHAATPIEERHGPPSAQRLDCHAVSYCCSTTTAGRRVSARRLRAAAQRDVSACAARSGERRCAAGRCRSRHDSLSGRRAGDRARPYRRPSRARYCRLTGSRAAARVRGSACWRGSHLDGTITRPPDVRLGYVGADGQPLKGKRIPTRADRKIDRPGCPRNHDRQVARGWVSPGSHADASRATA